MIRITILDTGDTEDIRDVTISLNTITATTNIEAAIIGPITATIHNLVVTMITEAAREAVVIDQAAIELPPCSWDGSVIGSPRDPSL